VAALVSAEHRKRAVWNKGRAIPGYDPAVWRHDALGNAIRWSDYGDRDARHGWEIDHWPTPKALGGSDDLSNLRPLHCIANARHGARLGNALQSR
jgi:hypothetical protein